MQLSEHFTLEELSFSEAALRKGIENDPPPEAVEKLKLLCAELLEPVHALLAVPLHVNSGYRSSIVNTLVGGDPHSAHMEGRAADIKPIGMDLHAAFETIRSSPIVFDRLIIECNAWLHLAIPKSGEAPKRVAETASGTPGHWVYTYA